MKAIDYFHRIMEDKEMDLREMISFQDTYNREMKRLLCKKQTLLINENKLKRFGTK